MFITQDMEVTNILAQGIEESDFELVTQPQLNVVAFTSDEMSADEISSKLKDKGWAVSIASYPRAVRIIVM